MISFTRYISITSGVGGNAAVATRDLIARIFTTNPLLPTGTVQEFASASDVSDYFGSTSEEYLRSAQYFGWISKSIEAAKKIAFCRWSDAANAPSIYGKRDPYLLATFTGITTGSLRLTLGATSHNLTAINFTGDVSLADVAATIQASIRTQATGMWTSATVVYNATRGSFDFVGGATGNNAVAVGNVGSGIALMNLIGWGAGAILSDGQDIQTVTALLADSTELNNNFGSFCFIPSMSNDEIVESATWNNTENVMFQFHSPVSAANAATLSPLVIGYAGCGLTLDPNVTGEYPEMMPMTVLAATNYERRNSAKNYMFQTFPTITYSVSENADANTYDALRVNYYGVTQTAGQQLEFYQRGFLMGGDTAPQDMGVYANEQWFKDACGAMIMSLLLTLDQVPASSAGAGQVLAVLQTVIDQALFNATIQVGKTLTTIQKLFVTNVTGDDTAWQQIQSLGYWVDAAILPYVENDITQYKVEYTIVYAKGDSVRLVEGADILI